MRRSGSLSVGFALTTITLAACSSGGGGGGGFVDGGGATGGGGQGAFGGFGAFAGSSGSAGQGATGGFGAFGGTAGSAGTAGTAGTTGGFGGVGATGGVGGSGGCSSNSECDDGDACTDDFCNGTSCQYTAVNVNDGNACTTDSCNPSTGVQHVPVSVDDGNACTTDSCNPSTGVQHVPVNVDDGNACTTDSCNPSTGVQHTPITCNDNNSCTQDSCNPASGCVYTPIGGGGTLFSEDFANNLKGWTLGSEWQIGPAVAGCNDPGTDTSPTTDNGIAGVVIGGCHGSTSHSYYYLTSPVINSASSSTVTLEFRRWLVSDYSPYVVNVVQVFNGSSWSTLYQTGASPGVNDTSWQTVTYDLTPYKNANMQIRWGFSVSGSVIVKGGWNIDDVKVTGGACN